MTRALPLLVAACTPPALDVPLDLEADRHWASGDAYRVGDDVCEASVTVGEGQATVGVVNEYFETSIAAVVVDPDCAPIGTYELAPGEETQFQVAVPKVVRVETLDGDILSAWAVFYPLGAAVIHVQP